MKNKNPELGSHLDKINVDKLERLIEVAVRSYRILCGIKRGDPKRAIMKSADADRQLVEYYIKSVTLKTSKEED